MIDKRSTNPCSIGRLSCDKLHVGDFIKLDIHGVTNANCKNSMKVYVYNNFVCDVQKKYYLYRVCRTKGF